MIKFYNQVPSVYPNASRDFQYLCWLIDIVLNAVKHNVNDIYTLPDNRADYTLTELLATTLGFKIKRNYDQAQLRALIVALPRILKYKGTKAAIDMAGEALLSASGSLRHFESEIDETGCELTVTFPETLVDISLFTDLLPYILPAGMTCHIERTDMVEIDIATAYDYNERLAARWVPDLAWNGNEHTTTGLTGMFDTPAADPVFANLKEDLTPNIGLLDNSVIPMLANTLHGTQSTYATKQNDYAKTVIMDESSGEDNNIGTTTTVVETE